MWPSSRCRCQFVLVQYFTAASLPLPVGRSTWRNLLKLYLGNNTGIKGLLPHAIYLAVSIYALGGMPTARPA